MVILLVSVEEFKVIGWGRTNNKRGDNGDREEGGAYKSTLQELNVPYIPIQTCKSNPTWKTFSKISDDRQICAGGRLRKYNLILPTESTKVLIKCFVWESINYYVFIS